MTVTSPSPLGGGSLEVRRPADDSPNSRPVADFRQSLRRAAMHALSAASVRDTQPWRWRLDNDGLRLYADYSRHLRVLDPAARQLIMSCGCALFNARASLAGDGFGVRVSRLPTGRPDVLACIAVDPTADDTSPPSEMPAPENLLDALEDAAAAEGVGFVVARRAEHQLALARLSEQAEALSAADPAYRAELRAWTTGNLSEDGWLTGWTTAPVAGTAADVAITLCTDGDTPLHWLRSGEALQRLVVESARYGYTVTPVPHVTAVSTVRARLRAELGLTGWPHVVLALRAIRGVRPTGRRRRLVDVLDETG
jgi:hypothetical protein